MLQQILQGDNEEQGNSEVETAKIDNKEQMDGDIAPESKVGKDGQVKDQENTGSQGVKHSYDKKDWKQ